MPWLEPATSMDTPFTEPRDGDVVVVRASSFPEGEPPTLSLERYAVIEWGLFKVVSDRMASLSKEDARLEARHCAAERARDAWDSTGSELAKLPRLPLVYRGVGDTYAISIDVTDYSSGQTVTAWKSMSHLIDTAALEALAADGVPLPIAKAMLGKAPMPLACS
jgi:hypothetical protein